MMRTDIPYTFERISKAALAFVIKSWPKYLYPRAIPIAKKTIPAIRGIDRALSACLHLLARENRPLIQNF